MSIFFAVRDGLNDARSGKPAYFWAIFTDSVRRPALMREGWRSIGKIVILAAVLDVIYQLIVLHGLRPLQTVLVSILLAVVPYLTLRGPINRIAKMIRR